MDRLGEPIIKQEQQEVPEDPYPVRASQSSQSSRARNVVVKEEEEIGDDVQLDLEDEVMSDEYEEDAPEQKPAAAAPHSSQNGRPSSSSAAAHDTEDRKPPMVAPSVKNVMGKPTKEEDDAFINNHPYWIQHHGNDDPNEAVDLSDMDQWPEDLRAVFLRRMEAEFEDDDEEDWPDDQDASGGGDAAEPVGDAIKKSPETPEEGELMDLEEAEEDDASRSVSAALAVDTDLELHRIISPGSSPAWNRSPRSDITASSMSTVRHHPWDDLVLPTIGTSVLGKQNKYGVPSHVVANMFEMFLKQAPKIIHRHKIAFVVPTRDTENAELHQQIPRSSAVGRHNLKAALRVLLGMVEFKHRDKFMAGVAGGNQNERSRAKFNHLFDDSCWIFSAQRIPDFEGSIAEADWKSKKEVREFIVSKKIHDIRYSFYRVDEIVVSGPDAKKTAEVQAYYTALAEQKMYKKNVESYKSASYFDTNVKDVSARAQYSRDGKVMKDGVNVSRREGPDGRNFLAIGPTVSAFYPEGPLLNFVKSFIKARTEREIPGILRNIQQFKALEGQLRLITVQTTHLTRNKNIMISGLHTLNAIDTTFELADGTVTNVDEYFVNQYKMRLAFPELPLIIHKQGSKYCHSPMEVLSITKCNKVPLNKQTKEQQEDMIRKACRRPADLMRDITETRKLANLSGGRGENEYLDAFGVQVNERPLELRSTKLHPPSIILRNNRPAKMDRNNPEKWRMERGDQYFIPAKQNGPIVVTLLGGSIRAQEAQQVMQNLMRMGHERGMHFSNNQVLVKEVPDMKDRLEQFMVEVKRTLRPAMFFFIGKEKMEPLHDFIKLMESSIGVVTQQICRATAQKMMNDRGGFMTTSNVLNKLNEKMGGQNISIAPPAALNRDLAEYNRALKEWFPNRMFVGLSFSHEGAQHLADRQMKIAVTTPSVVGMSYSLGDPGMRSCRWWYQEPREVIIQDLTRNFMCALEHYAEGSRSRRLPDSILIYRSGMSDSETKMAAYEVEQVREAVRAIGRKLGRDYNPTIETVLVISRTDDRLFSADQRDNVAPGTVVNMPTASNLLEFCLIAQKAIQGTSRPTRYVAVVREQGRTGKLLSADEHEVIANMMCCLDAVVNSPTKLPVFINDAADAAKRGQHNYHEAKDYYGEEAVRNDGAEDFYVRLSEKYCTTFGNAQFLA